MKIRRMGWSVSRDTSEPPPVYLAKAEPSSVDSLSSAQLEASKRIAEDAQRVITFVSWTLWMVFDAVWTIGKYMIYFSTWGIYCRPGYKKEELKPALKAILKIQSAWARKAAMLDFRTTFPRGVQQINQVLFERACKRALAPMGKRTFRQIIHWKGQNRAKCMRQYNKSWDDPSIRFLKQVVDLLQ